MQLETLHTWTKQQELSRNNRARYHGGLKGMGSSAQTAPTTLGEFDPPFITRPVRICFEEGKKKKKKGQIMRSG